MKLNDPVAQIILNSIEALSREELTVYAFGLALIVEGNIDAIKTVHIPEEVREEMSAVGDRMQTLIIAGLGRSVTEEIKKQVKDNRDRFENVSPKG